MVKAIIFDFGNVICRFTNEILLEKIANLSSKNKEEIRKIIYQDSDITKRFESGKISGKEFYEELSEICEINVPYQELKTIFSKDKFSRVYGIKELIEKLRTNYKVALLSNTSEWDWDYIEMVAPEILTFNAVTKSYEVGAMKPNEIIYQDALKKLDLKPEECIFVDDILEYTDKAKSLGLGAFQFVTVEKLVKDLESIGIEVNYEL